MNPRFVTVRRFSELTGYTVDAVHSKIKRGDWLQDFVFRKAPDGRVLIDLEGYEQWVLKGPATLADVEQAELARSARHR